MLMVFKMVSPNVRVISVGRAGGTPWPRRRCRGVQYDDTGSLGATAVAGMPWARGPESYLYYTLWEEVARFRRGFIFRGFSKNLTVQPGGRTAFLSLAWTSATLTFGLPGHIILFQSIQEIWYIDFGVLALISSKTIWRCLIYEKSYIKRPAFSIYGVQEYMIFSKSANFIWFFSHFHWNTHNDVY